MLSMESTSNRMSRLGKSLITDTELLSFERIIAEIDAVDAGRRSAELAAAAARAGAAVGRRASGRARTASARRSSGINPASLPRARGMKVALLRRGGKVGRVLGAGARGGGARGAPGSSTATPDVAGLDAAVDFTRPDAVAANVRAALEQGVPCVVGTTGLGTRERDRRARARARASRCFFAPNFALGAVLMMRFAARGRRSTCRAPRSSSCTTTTKLRRAVGHRARDRRARCGGDAADPLGAAARASSRTRRCCFGGAGQLLTIRHDTLSREAFVPGVLLALERLHALPPGLTVGLDALLDGDRPASAGQALAAATS